MIEQADTWGQLIRNYGSRTHPDYWQEQRPILEQLAMEPGSEWADEAMICLACGLADFEGDLDSGIELLRSGIERFNNEQTVIESWNFGRGCEFDYVWMLHASLLVAFDGAKIDTSKPLDWNGLEDQDREILAYHEHLGAFPILARLKARRILAQMYARAGQTDAAVAELESMIAENGPADIAALVAKDKEAAAGPHGYLIRHLPIFEYSPIWRAEYDPYLELARMHQKAGSTAAAADVFSRLVSAISPDGWYWHQNRRLGDMYAELERWPQALAQYEIAVDGILWSIRDWSSRREELAVLGEVSLPDGAESWEEVARGSDVYGISLERMQARAAEARSKGP